MLSPMMDDLGPLGGAQVPVAPVSPKGRWIRCIPLAGTVNSIAAATDANAPGAIALADVAATGLKLIKVPANCTYMEVGAWGDGSSIGTDPVLQFHRHHEANGNPTAGGDIWKPMHNMLGSATLTFDGTEADQTGVAGPSRYGIPESTYLQHLYDVRGATFVVVKPTTIGTSNNWSLWVRFF